jgi:hypothetical protein
VFRFFFSRAIFFFFFGFSNVEELQPPAAFTFYRSMLCRAQKHTRNECAVNGFQRRVAFREPLGTTVEGHNAPANCSIAVPERRALSRGVVACASHNARAHAVR